MRNFVSLRVMALTLTLASVLFLTSCGPQNQLLTSSEVNTETTIERSGPSFFDQIPTKYTSDENFLSCARQNIDMCMQEVAFMQEDGGQMNCDDFLSEQNRNSCRFTQTTAQAQSTQDITVCDSLDESFVGRCQLEVNMQIAMQSGDTTVCDSLEDFEKISCNNRIIMSYASSEMDISLCEGVMAYEGDETNFERTMCESEVQFMLDMQTQQAAELERVRLENEQMMQNQETTQ